MSKPLHIVRPGLLSNFGALSPSPVHVTIQAAAFFQLLEFSLRSNDDSRVIGTLLGCRSDDGSELEVRDAYIVPHHNEGGDAVTIEEYHHKVQHHLHKRSNPKDSIIGWFSTVPEFDSFTGLVHEFYSARTTGTYPYPAIHLTLSEDSKKINDVPTINTYIASSIGAIGQTANSLNVYKGSSYIFTPIPNKVQFEIHDKAVLRYSSSVVYQEKESLKLSSKAVDIELLIDHLNKVDALITSTLNYIEKVENREIKGDDKLARFLLTNLKTNVESINLEELKNSFNSHIQDTLMIEYLASSVKTQMELSAKLATLVN